MQVEAVSVGVRRVIAPPGREEREGAGGCRSADA
jgi:hypothetical protein